MAENLTLVTDFTEVRQRIKNMAATIKFEAARALYAESLIEMDEAKARTPVKTGALQGSGTVGLPQMQDRDIICPLAFGAGLTYAIYVHEDLEAHHDNGQAKFLESTLLESAPFMARRVAARIDLYRTI